MLVCIVDDSFCERYEAYGMRLRWQPRSFKACLEIAWWMRSNHCTQPAPEESGFYVVQKAFDAWSEEKVETFNGACSRRAWMPCCAEGLRGLLGGRGANLLEQVITVLLGLMA